MSVVGVWKSESNWIAWKRVWKVDVLHRPHYLLQVVGAKKPVLLLYCDRFFYQIFVFSFICVSKLSQLRGLYSVVIYLGLTVWRCQ